MKKVIWPILLFSFMIILAGCNVTNQEKENQNDENAVDSLDAVPTMEEWMELTQDAEEEEKAALYEQLQALLDEATEEEVQQAVENSVKDWAEKQEWLDVEAVFVELAADPLMMDEQTGERLYANRTAQVEIQYSREKGDATGLELQSLLLDQVAQAARGTPYGMFTLHTVQLACRRSADGVEVYGGSRRRERQWSHGAVPAGGRASPASGGLRVGAAVECRGVQQRTLQPPWQRDAAALWAAAVRRRPLCRDPDL